MKNFITTIIVAITLTTSINIIDLNISTTNNQNDNLLKNSIEEKRSDDDNLVDPSPLSTTVNL